jgi:hypothetical protein
MSWTLNNVSLADLGVEGLRIAAASRAGATATFSAPAATIASAIVLADGLAITIRQGAVVQFVGTIRRHTLSAAGGIMCDWQASDAWHDLGRVVYRQTTASVNSAGAEPETDVVSTFVQLYQARDGTRISAAAQITDIIACAAARGISIQAGTIVLQAPGVGTPPGDPIPLMPPQETRQDITCMEAINAVLDWAPDASAWIDLTTTPPSLHVQPAAALDVITLDLSVVANHPSALTVSPRPDMAIPGMRIIFEKQENEGRVFSVQEAGNPNAVGALEQTIVLSVTPGTPTEFQDCLTEPFSNVAETWWWRKRFPWLPDPVTLHDEVHDPEPDPEEYPNLPRILLAGSLQPWMNDNLQVFETTVTIEADYYLDGLKIRNRPLAVPLILTNLETKRYASRLEPAWMEEEPAGLAACLYASMCVTPHEGRIEFVDQDPDLRGVCLGKRLAFAGGQTSWETMNAVVQSIELSIADCRATITFGPPSHLAPQDLLELLRANRRRSILLAASLPRNDSGKPTAAAFPDGGNPVAPRPQNAPQAGCGRVDALEMTLGETNPRSMTFDPTQLAAGEAVAVRQISWISDGASHTAKVLATADVSQDGSAPGDPPSPLPRDCVKHPGESGSNYPETGGSDSASDAGQPLSHPGDATLPTDPVHPGDGYDAGQTDSHPGDEPDWCCWE